MCDVGGCGVWVCQEGHIDSEQQQRLQFLSSLLQQVRYGLEIKDILRCVVQDAMLEDIQL